MDWSLLGCGASGHVTFAPDEPGLRERLGVSTREGAAWRCLRCGTFVIGEPTASGPVSAAPRVRRDKELRSALILRVFAVERFLRAIIFGGLAIAVWRFAASRMSIEQAYDHALPELRAFLRQLGFNVNHSKLLGLIQHAFTLNSRTLTWLALAAAGVRGDRDHRGRRAVAAETLGRVLRDDRHLGRDPLRDLRPDREGDRAAAGGLRHQRGPGRLPRRHQAPLRRARRQEGLRGPAAQRVHPAGGDRRPGGRASRSRATPRPGGPAWPGGASQTGRSRPRRRRSRLRRRRQPATAADQPATAETAGKTDRPHRTQAAGVADQPPGTETARGPDQPTDAAATSSSAAE